MYGSLNNTSTQEVVHEKISVYPNPTSDLIFVENVKSLEKVEIYDLIGNLKGVHYQEVVDISSYSKGVYLLKVISEKGTTLIKVVKK